MYDTSSILSASNASYTPALNNLSTSSTTTSSDNSAATATTSSVDPRRYTQFDRTATDAGTADMSFSDFIDMVNPLQHIPIVSSVYRAITGDTINPVSRVVGDILYGGPMGGASAAVGGLGAIANSILESQTGSDATTTVMASLFGTDDQASIQAAKNDTPAVPDAVKAAQMPISLLASNIPVAPAKTATPQDNTKLAKAAAEKDSNSNQPSTDTEDSDASTQVASSSNQETADQDNTSPNGLIGSTGTKLLPLDRTRLVNMANAASNNIESQNRIIALSEGSHAMRLGHMIYTSPLMNGPKPMPNHPIATKTAEDAGQTTASTTAAQTAAPSAQSVPSTTPQQPSTADAETSLPVYMQTNPSAQKSILSAQGSSVPPALFDDVMILKRLSQYKSFATAPVGNGATLDIVN